MNRTYQDVQCAEASGDNWDKVCERLIQKRNKQLMDYLLEEDREIVQGHFLELDPHGHIIVETTTKNVREEREQNKKLSMIC